MKHLLALSALALILGCEQLDSTDSSDDGSTLYEVGETVTDFDSCIADCKASDHMGCAPVCNSVFTSGSCSVSNPGMQ